MTQATPTKDLFFLLTFFLVLAWAVNSHAQALAKVRASHLQHGMNIGSIGVKVSPECCGEPENDKAQKDIERLRQMRFDHVRLGIQLDYLLKSGSPATTDLLNSLDDLVKRLTDRGLAVIITMRLDSQDDSQRFNLSNSAFVDQFVWVWSEFSKRAVSRKYPADLVFFETVNEPHVIGADGQESPPLGDDVQDKLASAIRSVTHDYTIIATGVWGSILDGLISLHPLRDPDADSNVIYSFHYYNPYLFAQDHEPYLSGLKYPSDGRSTREVMQVMEGSPQTTFLDRYFISKYAFEHWDKARIASEISQVRQWAGNDRVVICDEFGVLKRDNAKADYRSKWVKDVRETLKKYGIGWTYWDYRDCPKECGHTGFGLFGVAPKSDEAVKIIRALGRTSPKS